MIAIAKQLALYDNSTVIGVVANKGGTGKTSLLTNLAGVLLKEHKRQLVIDLDSQSNVNDSFGLRDAAMTSANMFGPYIPTDQLITRYNAMLDVIQSHERMATLELDLLPQLSRYDDPFDFVHQHVHAIRHKYDYIWMDSPPSLSLIVGNVLLAADFVIIPFVPETYSVKCLMRMIDTVKMFQRDGHGVQILAVVPMFIEAKTVLHSQLLAQARRYCLENDVYISDTVIPSSIRFASATAFEQVPATMGRERNHKTVQSYFDLWQELQTQLFSFVKSQ